MSIATGGVMGPGEILATKFEIDFVIEEFFGQATIADALGGGILDLHQTQWPRWWIAAL